MLKIKLARFGKRKQPHYRIVVNEARDKRDGSYVENLGHYGPTQKPKLLELDLKRYQYWLEHGAQPTDTVAFLAEVAENGGKFPQKKKKPSKKKQSKKQAKKTQTKDDKDKKTKSKETESKKTQTQEEKTQDKASEDKKPKKESQSEKPQDKKTAKSNKKEK